MSEPLRLTVLKKILAQLAAAKRYGSEDDPAATAYFQTAKRGRMAVGCDKPAVLLARDSWRSSQRGGVDSVKHAMRCYIAVFLGNPDQNSATVGDELEYATATVERVMEFDKELRRLCRITPIGGVDGMVEAGHPVADVVMAYLVEYERARGNP